MRWRARPRRCGGLATASVHAPSQPSTVAAILAASISRVCKSSVRCSAAAVAIALTVSGKARAESTIDLLGCDALDRALLVELFTLEARTLKLSEARFELLVSCESEQA